MPNVTHLPVRPPLNAVAAGAQLPRAGTPLQIPFAARPLLQQQAKAQPKIVLPPPEALQLRFRLPVTTMGELFWQETTGW